MLAIHNLFSSTNLVICVANAFAKLSKCQQFTTITLKFQKRQGCKRFCKVIKMLAIHNCSLLFAPKDFVANAFAKLSKCQQFTTIRMFSYFLFLLQTLLQSYQNVSNSQQLSIALFFTYSCKRFCKVIKMLAIHNFVSIKYVFGDVANAFAKLSKCQQFTTQDGQWQ